MRGYFGVACYRPKTTDEDGSLPPDVVKACDSRVVIPGAFCLNLATAGSIVLYDRIAKASRDG